MDTLKIDTRSVRGISIVDLEGKITIGGTNRQLQQTLRRMVEKGDTRVILNLSKVGTIDSSGLGEIVAGYTTMKRAGGVLRLANISQRVTDLMTITKLYTVFDIFDSEDKALRSFETETRASAKSVSSIL